MDMIDILNRVETHSKFFSYWKSIEKVGNNFNYELENGENGVLNIEEYRSFIKDIESFLNEGIISSTNTSENIDKVRGMMRSIDMLKTADAFDIKTKIDYKKLKQDIINNNLKEVLIDNLRKEKYSGHLLSGLIQEGIIQDFVKDKQSFDEITENTDFMKLTKKNDYKFVLSYDVIIDLYRRGLINREDTREIVGVNNIADLYIQSTNNTNSKNSINNKKNSKADLFSLVQEEDLYELFKNTKNPKYLRIIQVENIIDRYILDNISTNQYSSPYEETIKTDMEMIKKCTNINSQTIIDYFYGLEYRYNDIKLEHVVQLLMQKDFPKNIIPESNKLFELYESGLLIGKDMLELASVDRLDSKTLLKVFTGQEKLKEIYKSEQLFPDETVITPDDFITYFTSEKSLEMINNKETRKQFVEQYKKVLSSLEDEKRFDVERELVNEIYNQNKNNETKALLETLKLFNNEIITKSESFVDKVKDDEIIEIFNRKDLTEELLKNGDESSEEQIDNIISKLYKAKLVDIDTVGSIYLEKDDNNFEKKLLEQYIKDNLDEEVFSSININNDILKSYIQENKIPAKKVLDMFGKEIIGIDLVKEMEIENISEQIVKGYPEDKLKDLYAEGILTYSDLIELNLNDVIPGKLSEIREEYNKSRDAVAEIRELMETGKLIHSSAEDKTHESRNTNLRIGKSNTNNRGIGITISEEAKKEFFEAIGVAKYIAKDKNGKTELVTEKEAIDLLERKDIELIEIGKEITNGSLEGYNILYIPKLDAAILENEKEEGNATYIMNMHGALDKAKSSTKKGLREEKGVKRKLHTGGWGVNTLATIAEINGFDKKELLKEYLPATKKIAEDYKVNKAKRYNER